MSYLAEKYAHLLSKDDVLDLFEQLEEVFKGNLSEACRKCGIQRKTRYDWISARSLKLSTKKKILKAMIETNPEKALDFLLTHSKGTSVELLSTYLSHIYSRAMSEIFDPRPFVNSVKKFEKVKRENVGLIWELEEELGEMTYNIREKAKALKVPLPMEHLETINPNHIIEAIPAVVDAIIRRGDKSFSEIATGLRIPEKLVRTMHQAIMMPFHVVAAIETTQSEPRYGIPRPSPTTKVEYPNVWDGGSLGLV